MAVVEELIRVENENGLSFGDYTLNAKKKVSDFEFHGDMYKVKTYRDITKLEKNELFVYESVPGTAVTELSVTDNGVSFSVEGPEDAQITLELEENAEAPKDSDGNKIASDRPIEPPVIKSITVETFGVDYGIPTTLDVFDYYSWLMQQYYGYSH